MFLARPSSVSLRWCPWEIDYAYGLKGFGLFLWSPLASAGPDPTETNISACIDTSMLPTGETLRIGNRGRQLTRSRSSSFYLPYPRRPASYVTCGRQKRSEAFVG